MHGNVWSEQMAFSKACIIRNVSATGARIDLASGTIRAHLLTGTITLYFQSDNREIDCQVMWRTGRSIGVRFVGSFRPPTRQYGARSAAS